jgi:hypothetical protein
VRSTALDETSSDKKENEDDIFHTVLLYFSKIIVGFSGVVFLSAT